MTTVTQRIYFPDKVRIQEQNQEEQHRHDGGSHGARAAKAGEPLEGYRHPKQRLAAKVGRFLWHFVQMILAMMVGMGVYHLLTGKTLAAYPVLNFAGMELSMVPPMVGLMRYHRHSWQRSLEMAAAMLAGPAVFLVCAQFGLHTYIPGLSRATLFALSDISMYVGMLGVMLYRRAEYTMGHAGHQHAGSSEAETTKHATHDTHEAHRREATGHATQLDTRTASQIASPLS